MGLQHSPSQMAPRNRLRRHAFIINGTMCSGPRSYGLEHLLWRRTHVIVAGLGKTLGFLEYTRK